MPQAQFECIPQFGRSPNHSVERRRKQRIGAYIRRFFYSSCLPIVEFENSATRDGIEPVAVQQGGIPLLVAIFRIRQKLWPLVRQDVQHAIASKKALLRLENTENMFHRPISMIDINFRNIKTPFG